MTPACRSRYGCDAEGAKWKAAVPPISMSKRASVPQLWPPHPHRPGGHGAHCPPPPLGPPAFHTRHAEESAGRPRLVTVICPCGQSDLRKVTVLLNRRGVVSFDQLLLDISEALGFPRWHRARVTRLYTPQAREVRGMCDFFRGEVAFLALGKARPELQGVQEALEELFPEHSAHRADLLRAWEKRLRPTPDAAAKADSGYGEGTDGGEGNARPPVHQDGNVHAKARRGTLPHLLAEAQRQAEHNLGAKRPHKKPAATAHPPNHLQKVRVRGGPRERRPSVIGPLKQEAGQSDHSVPRLCARCSGEGALQFTQVVGRVPLPPVSRKPKETSQNDKVRHADISPNPPPPPLQPIRRIEEKRQYQSQHVSSTAVTGPGLKHEETQQRLTFDLLRDRSDVTLSDIESCYDIGRVLGDGNFAVVRECRRRDNGQTLALKIVERSKLIGREHMMQNELCLLGTLSHPRVVRLFAHHHTQTHCYLVMELVGGGDLFEAIAERRSFSEAEAGLMVSDVSDALSYIHNKSIVHRDIKPENLLVESGDNGGSRLKLGDFGLAMVVTEPVFTICGTPTYVAPEILSETGYGVAVDVWALGVILYILLCGFPPFRSHDRDQEELFKLIQQGEFRFQSPYWDPISEGARSLVKALLQRDPKVRLTAAQTLAHPWVQAMASTCHQGASKDQPKSNMAASGRNQEGSAQATTVETPRDIEATRSQQRFTQMNTTETDSQHQSLIKSGTIRPQQRQAQNQSTETGEVQTIPQQINVDHMHANSETTTKQQKHQHTSTDPNLLRKDFKREGLQGSPPSTTISDSVEQTSPSVLQDPSGVIQVHTSLSASEHPTSPKQNILALTPVANTTQATTRSSSSSPSTHPNHRHNRLLRRTQPEANRRSSPLSNTPPISRDNLTHHTAVKDDNLQHLQAR